MLVERFGAGNRETRPGPPDGKKSRQRDGCRL